MKNDLYFIGRWGNMGRNTFENGYLLPFDNIGVISSSSKKNSDNYCFSFEKNFKERKENIYAWYKNEVLNKKGCQFLPFYPCKIESEFIVLQNDVNKTNFVESKQNLDLILQKSGINQSCRPTIFNDYNNATFEVITKKIGLPFIVQTNSRGGRGTFLIENENDYNIICKSKILRISKFEKGITLNVCSVIMPTTDGKCKVFVEYPSFKPTNIKNFEGRKFSGKGNEWGSILIKQLSSIVKDVVLIGEYLYYMYNIKGAWGVDIIYNIHEQKYVILEINPRLQGTHEVATINQVLRNFPPFFLIHCISFLPNYIDNYNDLSSDEYNNNTIKLCEIYDIKSAFYIKIKFNKNIIFDPTPDFKGDGLYKIANNKLEFYENSNNTIFADLDEDLILIVNTPDVGVLVNSGLEICMIEGIKKPNNVIFDNDENLSSNGEKIVKLVKILLNVLY